MLYRFIWLLSSVITAAACVALWNIKNDRVRAAITGSTIALLMGLVIFTVYILKTAGGM